MKYKLKCKSLLTSCGSYGDILLVQIDCLLFLCTSVNPFDIAVASCLLTNNKGDTNDKL